jgi:uncharacterized protein with NRDE domain
MGVTRSGRFAALTNVRDPRSFDPTAPSRGTLVVGFLLGRDDPADHLAGIAAESVRRNGYNLIAGASGRLAWCSNTAPGPREVVDGVHAVSNASFDSPWPKVRRSAARLSALLAARGTLDFEELFALLADREPAPDTELPDTGVGLPAERRLSPPFITTPEYGTRSSTLLVVSKGGRASFLERRFDSLFNEMETSRFDLDLGGWDVSPGGRKGHPEMRLQDA